MSSILTNTSAMVALQTLKMVNKDLNGVQSQISTGKKVDSAKDNSAVWAISKVMESDVKGFKAISESLSLGESTVAVARSASEATTDLLTEIKGKIIAAQEENVDRAKLQTDIDALVDQIGSITSGAQFNGLNLVNGFDDVNILSSLDRANDGTVNAAQIQVNRQDLTTQAGSLGTGGGLTDLTSNITESSLTVSSAAVRDDGAAVPTAADIGLTGDFSGDSLAFNIGGTSITFAAGELDATNTVAAQQITDAINAAQIEGISVTNNAGTLEFASTVDFAQTTVSVTQGGASAGTLGATSVTLDQRAESLTFANTNVNEGDGYQVSLSGGVVASYVAAAGETMEDVVKGLKAAIDGNGDDDITTLVNQNSNNEWVLNIATSGSANETITLVANDDANENAVITGGLANLDTIDVSTNEGADKALDNIEVFIQNSIAAAAAFGSAQGRIETQSDFVGELIDNFKAGIGTLVDADMEAASARLQALQVQQQLATQSLSIANQAPQSILALFR